MRDWTDADMREFDRKLGFLGAILIPVSAISLLILIESTFDSQVYSMLGVYLRLFVGQVFFVTGMVGGTFLFLAIRGLAQSYRSEVASRYVTYGFACGVIALVFVCLLIYYPVVWGALFMFLSPEPMVFALALSASCTFLLVAHVFFMKALDFLSKKTSTRLISKSILLMSYVSLFVGIYFAIVQIFLPTAELPSLVLFLDVVLVLLISWIPVAWLFFRLKIPTDASYKTEFSKMNGGVLITISLVISIVASIVGFGLFDVNLTIPVYHFGHLGRVSMTQVITIMTQSFTVPLFLAGISFVVLALKNLGEHYSDSRITKNAIYGFIFLTCCSAATMISTLGAHTIYLTPVTPVTPPLTESPHDWSVVLNDPQTDLFFSWPSLIFLLLSSLFFARALVLLSDRSRKRYITAIAVLLIVGTLVTVGFSVWIFGLRYSGYNRFSSPVLLDTEWHLDQILVWITLLGIGLLLVAWAATSRALNSIKKELLRNDSNMNERTCTPE